MKKKILRLISCLVALALTLTLLAAVIYVTNRKSSISKYKDFFEEEKDYDVLFFGSSVVINSVFPMQLWQEQGITSYNFGGHANYISTSYWVMRNALDYTTPKVAVLDCRNLRVDSRYHDQYQFLHMSLDAFPLSKTKVEAVNDLLRDEETENADMLRKEMLFPFTSYHNRWDSLTNDDFSPKYNVEKGAEIRMGVAVPAENDPTPTGKTITTPSVNRDYLERFITDCQSRDIEVLLLYIPTTSPEPYKEEAQTIPQIAEQYGVQHLNLLQMGIVDFNTDCYDPEPHLNPSGAYKVTSYLGNYLTEQYDLTSHKDDAAYADWHADYETYLQYRQTLFSNPANNMECVTTLMLDGSFDFMIQLTPEVMENARAAMMLKNLGVDAEKLPPGGGFVLIQKGTRNMEYIPIDASDQQTVSTILGSMSVDSNAASVVLNGTTLLSESQAQWQANNLRLYLIAEGTSLCREFAIAPDQPTLS